MSLTPQLRDELSRVEHPDRTARLAETSAMLRFGGAWTMRDGQAGWVFETRVASVLRRVHRSLTEVLGVQTSLEAQEPTALERGTRYRLRATDHGALTTLGLVEAGRPQGTLPEHLLGDDPARAAYARGALMAAGTLSAPGKEAHLEIRAPSAQAAEDVTDVLHRLGARAARTAPHGDAWRVVCKSGDEIGTVLAKVGAHGAFLAFDEGRLRRQLRGEATRAANADRANLGRAVAASARQVRTIERLLTDGGWDDLPSDVKETALARLANPQASLSELADLLGSTRTTVHRRLLRLEVAASDATGWVASDDVTGSSSLRVSDN